MKCEIFTAEAGAGSYPEPPYVPEPELPECEECYETRDVAIVDGHALCPHCKADYIFRHADYDDYMRFILDNLAERTEFFVKWYFDNLSDFEKQDAVRFYFENWVPQKEREIQATSYVSECKPDFADFMERMAKRYGGV